MMGPWLPRRSCVAAVVPTLMALSPRVALVRARFLQQVKSECHFSNGTERVWYLQRHIYNQEEHLRFDSKMGKYQAVTKLGKIQAEYWNSQEGFLEQKRAKVDTFCRFNYAIVGLLTVLQRAEPRVTVYLTKTQPLEHRNLLVCSVSGFYPGHIEVRWFQNDQEEKAGIVSTGLIRNGDWTFQILVMLETVPQSGEVYTCQVEHPSLTSPVTVEWRAQSTSAQNKMLSGIGGFVLGLLFFWLGLFIYFRNQKGWLHPGPQAAPRMDCLLVTRLDPSTVHTLVPRMVLFIRSTCLSLWRPTCLSHLSVTLEAHLSVPPVCHLEAHLSVTLEAHLSVTLEAHLSVTLEAHLSVTLEAHLSVTLEAHLSVTLEIHLSVTLEAHQSVTLEAHLSVTLEAHLSVTLEAHLSVTL
ncbi:H-2 class II histocompatibility antigen, E-S beta chain isoform X2 [Cricetulus griseus]|uniref:H-2 class II histocompatibility antigen, E-S beta chain isoform X2 n=1 Tax=Cricetulus griseus TaxID=10029 RepID=A0A9J7HD48_CRIGR|nr:H-2 class II histocompatibility antigen, E-S beta chain isoform X2 [Cricetulus griseus]